MGRRIVSGEFKPDEKTQLEAELKRRYPAERYPIDIEVEQHSNGSVTVTSGNKERSAFPTDYDFSDGVNTALKMLSDMTEDQIV